MQRGRDDLLPVHYWAMISLLHLSEISCESSPFALKEDHVGESGFGGGGEAG